MEIVKEKEKIKASWGATRRRRRRQEGVQECNLKHFILTINFLFCLSCFNSFTLSNAFAARRVRKKKKPSIAVRTFKVEMKLDLPLSVKFILMKDVAARNSLKLKIIIIFFTKNVWFYQTPRYTISARQSIDTTHTWMGFLVKCFGEKKKSYCVDSFQQLPCSHNTREISRKTISCIWRLRLNLQFQWNEMKSKEKKKKTLHVMKRFFIISEFN